jgi:tetratricopeptide (TPR) repeat protein
MHGKERDESNIIHVAFGPGGGRIPTKVPPADPEADVAVEIPRSPSMPDGMSGGPKGFTRVDLPALPREVAAYRSAKEEADARMNAPFEPTLEMFSTREVTRLLGLPSARLRALDKAGIVTPSGESRGRRAYTFTDLIALRATSELLRNRVRMGDVARAVGVLRRTLPTVTRPLQELRITSDGRRVIVRAEGTTFEPLTGQVLLDFQVDSLQKDVVALLRPDPLVGKGNGAYDMYLKASQLDENPEQFVEAERLYREAIAMDPHLAIAYTNLGNLRFRQGDEPGAEILYLQALRIDTAQPEAHYNLGYLMLERGEHNHAVFYFQRAIEEDPRFSDAYFNLAMAYEAQGERASARRNWKQYLELEPEGAWADIARQHL